MPYLQWHRVCYALLAPLCQYLNQQNQSCHEKELQWIRSVSCYLLSFLVVKFFCLVSFHHFTWVDCVLNSCIMQGNFCWHSAWVEQVHILCKKCLSLTWYQTHGKNTATQYCKLICKRKRKPLYGLVGKKMFWSIGHFRLDFQKLSCSKQDQVQNLLIEFFNNINQKKTELS